MEIQEVKTKSDLKRFINFPYNFHRNAPNWIPPLRLDQKNIFNPEKNSVLNHCEYQPLLLYKNNKIIGRIVVYVNHIANKYWNEKIGFFGHYECINDPCAAMLLLETAEKWLLNHDILKMRGQWNFVSQDIGFICEGFDIPPIFLSSYNQSYYNDQMVYCGMKKAKDLFVYSCDMTKGYKIPGRFLSFTDQIAERYRVTVRAINMRNLVEDAKIIVRLTNESIADNWGFYPVDETEANQIAADLKMIIHPEVVLIAEVDSEPIGFIIALPDVNHILKNMNGRLFPFGIFKLLRGIKKIKRYRIWALGILPPYQKKGISVLMFRRLNDLLKNKGVYVEANWVLEDNTLMNNALNQLKFDLVKKYRIYEKQIG